MRPSHLLSIQDSKSRDDATHENSGRKRNEDSENSVKNTKGGKMGRWTPEEKQRFIDGKLHFQISSISSRFGYNFISNIPKLIQTI